MNKEITLEQLCTCLQDDSLSEIVDMLQDSLHSLGSMYGYDEYRRIMNESIIILNKHIEKQRENDV